MLFSEEKMMIEMIRNIVPFAAGKHGVFYIYVYTKPTCIPLEASHLLYFFFQACLCPIRSIVSTKAETARSGNEARVQVC